MHETTAPPKARRMREQRTSDELTDPYLSLDAGVGALGLTGGIGRAGRMSRERPRPGARYARQPPGGVDKQ